MVDVRKQGSNNSMRSVGGGSKKVDVRMALSEQNKMGDLISDLGEDLQQERVDASKAKLRAIKEFKNEMGVAVCKSQLLLQGLQKKLRECVYG